MSNFYKSSPENTNDSRVEPTYFQKRAFSPPLVTEKCWKILIQNTKSQIHAAGAFPVLEDKSTK